MLVWLRASNLIILPSLNWLLLILVLPRVRRFVPVSAGWRRVSLPLPIFSGLRSSADHWISALRDDDGSIISSPEDLGHCLCSFHSSLFTASPTDPAVQTAFLGNLSSSLDSDQAALCKGLLTPEECFTALHGMARRTALALTVSQWNFMLSFGVCWVLILFLF